MIKTFITVLLVFIFVLSMSAIAGQKDFRNAKVATAADEARFEEMLKNATSTLSFPKLPNELTRTWYDYACNNISGRILAHAYGVGTDGIHFTPMKRQPNAAGNRYVVYDYWDNGLGFFFGNQSITELQATGWGRVVNGANDEAIVSHHGGGAHLWQDAGEFSYSFSEITLITGGLFPGIAVKGDTVVMISNLDGTNYSFTPNDIQVSTDYMQNWTTAHLWSLEAGATEYGPTELWPTFDHAGNMSVLYGPDLIGANADGQVKMATTGDLGANWTTQLIYDETSYFPEGTFFPGKTTFFHIQNFNQFNSMYSQDGTYHTIFGAIQGWADTSTSVGYDYHPILYWNTREQQLVDIASPSKSYPADSSARSTLQSTYAGNMLGGLNYPTLSEGPNGELVAIWQEWEDDGSGYPVMATGVGGTPFPCSDIVGAYSSDAGMTWEEPFWLAGTAGESDVYPCITKDFYFNGAGDTMILDIAYMWDTNIGNSVVGTPDSDPSECIWYYEQVRVPKPVTGIDDQDIVLKEFNLSQNYPNPFNPSTNIKFNLLNETDVTLNVFNVLGEKVATLINGKVKAGETVARFDGTSYASGVYYYQLMAGDIVQTRKMLLVK